MTGYDDDPEALRPNHSTRLQGGWLYTGDLGYVAGDELFVVGREDFRLVLENRQIFPDEIELVASTVDGVRSGAVVAFQETQGTIAVTYEIQEGADEDEVANALKRRLSKHFDFPIALKSVSTRSIPKSPGGKTRRHICLRLHENGLLDRRDRQREFAGLRRIALRARHEALKLSHQVVDMFSRKTPPRK